MLSYQYRKSHCGDKLDIRPSYLHNEISYTSKMAYLSYIDGLVQERRNSIGNAPELHGSCTNPSIVNQLADAERSVQTWC